MKYWEELLAEGEPPVKKVREHLQQHNIQTGESEWTEFGTKETIPIYDDLGNKVGWVLVIALERIEATSRKDLPRDWKGWMCGQVRSKKWENPPAVIIWYCKKNGAMWAAVIPQDHSDRCQKWEIFPSYYGEVEDRRLTDKTGETQYCYPSYCVPIEETISLEEGIEYIRWMTRS